MPPLLRDITSLRSKTFDVLVVGGGIVGVAVAWDAALRGLSVALVEKNDFGSETSAGCFKLVHGGIRYLQHLDFSRVLESIREQYILRKIAPQFVHPLPFLIPCYGRGVKGKQFLRVGMMLYELLACGRNTGLDVEHHLPKHQLLKAEECLKIAPGLNQEGLRGGVIFSDCQMSNCERLTFSVAKAAIGAGACLGNYLEVVKFQSQSTVPQGLEKKLSVSVKDALDGKIFPVEARSVVNATGPWSSQLLSCFQAQGTACAQGEISKHKLAQIYSHGFQVTLPKLIDTYAVFVESPYFDKSAVLSRGTRSYIITPWRGHSLIGTTDSLWKGEPDNFEISRDDIRNFVTEIAEVYRSDLLTAEHVRYAFGGLRPVDPRQLSIASENENRLGNAKTQRHCEIIDHAHVSGRADLPQVENFVTVVGTKYTTFRSLAEQVVDLLCEKLSLSNRECRTKSVAIAGGAMGNYSRYMFDVQNRASALFGISAQSAKHLIVNYGTEVEELFALIQAKPDLAQPVCDTSEVLRAEVVYACSQMAETLNDVMFRRTGLGTLGDPGEAALRITSELVAAELGWSKSRVDREVLGVRKIFASRSD